MDRKQAAAFVFDVTALEGKPVSPPSELPWESVRPIGPGRVLSETRTERTWIVDMSVVGEVQPQPVDGQEWVMFGYETGRATGCPMEITFLFPDLQNPFQPGEFVTEFRFAFLQMMISQGRDDAHRDHRDDPIRIRTIVLNALKR